MRVSVCYSPVRIRDRYLNENQPCAATVITLLLPAAERVKKRWKKKNVYHNLFTIYIQHKRCSICDYLRPKTHVTGSVHRRRNVVAFDMKWWYARVYHDKQRRDDENNNDGATRRRHKNQIIRTPNRYSLPWRAQDGTRPDHSPPTHVRFVSPVKTYPTSHWYTSTARRQFLDAVKTACPFSGRRRGPQSDFHDCGPVETAFAAIHTAYVGFHDKKKTTYINITISSRRKQGNKNRTYGSNGRKCPGQCTRNI